MLKHFVATLVSLTTAIASASGSEWPTRPVTMVVPFSAGGPLDAVARLIGPRIGAELKQPVIIENVTGAGGMTGGNRVATAPPDGYMFLYGNNSTHTFTQLLNKKPLYDANADFAPVAVFIENSKVLLVRPDLPVKDMGEFASYLRANAAKMQFGSSGVASASHVACLLLNSAIGVDNVVHVPYRGLSFAIQDLMTGRVDYLCEIISSASGQIKAGTVRALALLSPKRSPSLPDLATADEQGLRGFDIDGWNGFFFPKGTPPEIVHKLEAVTDKVMDDPELQKQVENLGLNVAAKDHPNQAYLKTAVANDLVKWRKPLKAAGLLPE
jgi:tripartite-type tricarboxylate transporter receptor subunit TctC